jgi:hypothetical protein
MNKFISIATSLLFAGIINAQVIEQWDFNDVNGTGLTSVANSAGSTSWAQDITGGASTDGSGFFRNTADTSENPSNADIADLSSGVYEFTAFNVDFTGLGGGTDDMVGIGFRNGSSTAGWGTSSFDLVTLRVGNIDNDTTNWDAIIRVNSGSGPVDTVLNDVAAYASAIDFTARYDLDNNEASFFYDSGAGRVQIGTTISGVTSNVSHLAFALGTFSNTLEVDSLALTAIPEPSTFILVGVAFGALAIFRRRK